MRPEPTYRAGVFAIVAGATVVSTNGLIFRLIDEAVDFQIIFWRSYWVCVTFLVIVTVASRGRPLAAIRAVGLPGLIGGIFLGLANVGFSLAIVHATVANALFVLSAAPFVTAVAAWLLLRERVERVTLVAMVAALAGIAVMVSEGLAAGRLYGNLMAVLSMFGFAGFVIALRFGRGVDQLPVVAIGGMAGSATAALLAPGLAIPLGDFALCALMGCVVMTCGLFGMTYGARVVPAAQITLLGMTEVVLGPVWAWLGVGETPSVPTLAGGALILAAVAGQALFTMGRAPDAARPVDRRRRLG